MRTRTYRVPALLRAGLALAVTAGLASCAGSSGKDSTVTLSVQPGTGVTTLIEIAKQQGFFKDVGLDVRFKSVTTGPAAATALASGSVDVATNAPEVFTPIVDKGTDLQVIAGQTKTVGMLAARKDAVGTAQFPESVRALKGKSVAVTALSSTTQRLVEMILKAAGMKPTDVKFVASGRSVDQALITGSVDAGLVTGPQINRVLDAGVVSVVDLRTPQSCPTGIAPCGISQVGMWAKSDWVKKHQAQVGKVQKAIAKADAWVHDPANRQKALEFIGGQLGDQATPQARQSYTESQLQVLTSVFAEQDLAQWLTFDKDNAITSHHLDAKKLMAPGVPQKQTDVDSLAAKG